MVRILQEAMATKLLTTMLLVADICDGALIGKSSAHNFLLKIRQRRGFECSPGGCSTEASEAGEVTEVKEGNEESQSMLHNGAAATKETITKPTEAAKEAEVFEGSGTEPKRKPPQLRNSK
ncbi:uncharacterized protein LOC144992215 [Oryzias latipes]